MTAEARDATLGQPSGTTTFEDLGGVRSGRRGDRREPGGEARGLRRAGAGRRSDHTIFLSNTSSLCITELAAATKRPDRFGGLHFFNPVPLMKLVEVIRGADDERRDVPADVRVRAVAREGADHGADRPGFIVNRLLVPYLLDAVRAYENGLGTIEDIDKGMKLGCGYPMGPFTLLDFVGLDTTYYIANIMFEEFREPAYAPPPLLKRMVLAGRLGRKSGQGLLRVPRSKVSKSEVSDCPAAPSSTFKVCALPET